jgi:hypothetical protein
VQTPLQQRQLQQKPKLTPQPLQLLLRPLRLAHLPQQRRPRPKPNRSSPPIQPA